MKPPLKPSQLYGNLILSFISLTITFCSLELAARISMPFHAPILLRDGIYVNALPLVTGVAPASLLSHHPKGKRLPEKKPAGEIRIFVYGESSVQGIPLDEHASAPTMLYDMLSKAEPHRKIKVINMGRTASISANVYYYLLYTRRYAPDFIIFYMGINDGGGMPGEQCWLVSHPKFYTVWRWLMSKSWLLWNVRVFGPALLWSMKPEKKGSQGINWNCPADPFSQWTDLLVKTSASTGAKVIVTTPVQSAVSCIEPRNLSSSGKLEKPTMPDSYQKLLACRLTEGCDFMDRFKDYINYNTTDNKTNISFKQKEPIDANKASLFKQYKYMMSYKGNAWRTAANHYTTDFIDFRTALEKASPHGVLADKFFADEIHLKPEGYYYLASFWFEHIREHLSGIKPHKPQQPSFDDVKRYYKAPENTGISMSMHYLMRGWYLTAIPGLEMISKHCPSGKCDERADIALGWLRKKAGLALDSSKELAEKVKKFSPENYQY